MKKALSLVSAAAAAALLGVAVVPQTQAAAKVDQAALNAQIDARLHNVLGRLARDAQARRHTENAQEQVASR